MEILSVRDVVLNQTSARFQTLSPHPSPPKKESQQLFIFGFGQLYKTHQGLAQPHQELDASIPV